MISFGSRISRLELRHLMAALALAEEGGFGRAAARLGIAQPLFSTLVQRLEQAAGARLFERRPAAALTPAGAALVEQLEAAFAHVEAGFEKVEALAAGRAGSLAIAFPTWLLATVAPDAVRLHRQARPDVELTLHDISSAAQLERLRSGGLDVAFLRAAAVSAPDLHAEVLSREPFCIVAPDDQAGARSGSLAAYADRAFVGFPRDAAPELHDQISRLFGSAGVAPRVVQEAREWLAQLVLVRAGVGLCVAPASIARLWGEGLAFTEITDPGAVSTVHVCRRADDRRALVEDFFATLRSVRDGGPQAISTR